MSEHRYFCESLSASKQTWEPEPEAAPESMLFDRYTFAVRSKNNGVSNLGRPRKLAVEED